MRHLLAFVAVVIVIGGAFILSAWETAVSTDGNWKDVYLSPGEWPTADGSSGFTDNEHAELAGLALQQLNLTAYTMGSGKGLEIVDLNASLNRKQRLQDDPNNRVAGQENDSSHLLVRRLPPLPHFSGVPDFSYTLYDWINKNTLCPPLPSPAPSVAPACYGYVPGWLSALNSSHFGSQASANYRHLHATALWSAAKAAEIREKLREHPEDLKAYTNFVREAEMMALMYEAVAQHFLQDRWSVAHMWERWGSANYENLPRQDLGTNVAVGITAGLIHGAQAVVEKAEGALAIVGIVKADPMAAPLIQGGIAVPAHWRFSHLALLPLRPGASAETTATFDSPDYYNGVGDDRLRDMMRGKFGADVRGIEKDYPLDAEKQREMMLRCMQAGWIEVIQKFGKKDEASNGFGIDNLVVPSDSPNWTGCFDAWATNEAIRRGWEENLNGETVSDLARAVICVPLSAVNAAQATLQGTSGVPRICIDRIAISAMATRIRLAASPSPAGDPGGTDVAQGIDFDLIDDSGVVAKSGNNNVSKTGDEEGDAPKYFEPTDLDTLPDALTQKGRDKKTIFGFFNRATAGYWCDQIQNQTCAELVARFGRPNLRAACRYIGDRAYMGTIQGYGGPGERVAFFR